MKTDWMKVANQFRNFFRRTNSRIIKNINGKICWQATDRIRLPIRDQLLEIFYED